MMSDAPENKPENKPVNLMVERARRGIEENWNVRQALEAALYELDQVGDKDSLFWRGDPPVSVYVAFTVNTPGGGQGFPSVASSGSRLEYMGMLAQHLNNEANSIGYPDVEEEDTGG